MIKYTNTHMSKTYKLDIHVILQYTYQIVIHTHLPNINHNNYEQRTISMSGTKKHDESRI